MVCLLAAPWVQSSVSAGSGWPHNALRHHWLMPISCHFRDCKALVVTSLTHVSGAIASARTFTFTFIAVCWLEWCCCKSTLEGHFNSEREARFVEKYQKVTSDGTVWTGADRLFHSRDRKRGHSWLIVVRRRKSANVTDKRRWRPSLMLTVSCRQGRVVLYREDDRSKHTGKTESAADEDHGEVDNVVCFRHFPE